MVRMVRSSAGDAELVRKDFWEDNLAPGAIWRCLGCLEGVLEGLGGVLRASWKVLKASWELLGGSWRRLESL